MARSNAFFGVLVLLAAFISVPTIAQECTPQWATLLDTDPSHPKGIAGDSEAAYAWLNFWGDPTIKLVLKGRFPRARFMSLETNETRWGMKGESLLDYQLEPDAGSMNPFREGVSLDVTDRSFTIEVVPHGLSGSGPNVIHLGKHARLQQSFLYRIYAPNGTTSVTLDDLPRVFAYDVKTGAPAACPISVPLTETLNLPQFLTLPVHHKAQFDFKTVQVPWGPNSAIPAYVGAGVRTRRNEIAIVRFKAPTATSTDGGGVFSASAQVRYWSFCALNLVKLTTLDCISDRIAREDGTGLVTVVYGHGDDLRVAAEARGYTFLDDTREANQPVAEFVYRNILPQPSFATESLYQGAYRPRGALCRRDAFLAGGCESE